MVEYCIPHKYLLRIKIKMTMHFSGKVGQPFHALHAMLQQVDNYFL
jgi:hypothetical protein